jgi:hypothetical protein
MASLRVAVEAGLAGTGVGELMLYQIVHFLLASELY